MEPLLAAQNIYDSTFRNLAGKEVETDADTAMQIATFCATLAQAEAARPRYVQIGERVINLAHVAFVDLAPKAWADDPRVEVAFSAGDPNGGMIMLTFRGPDYEPAATALRAALAPHIVASTAEPPAA